MEIWALGKTRKKSKFIIIIIFNVHNNERNNFHGKTNCCENIAPSLVLCEKRGNFPCVCVYSIQSVSRRDARALGKGMLRSFSMV